MSRREARRRHRALQAARGSASDLRNWQIWRDPLGDEILIWGRAKPSRYDELTLVFEFQSENWLTAHQIAFGRRPAIDTNIRELVALINDLPGMQTTGCCQGHRGKSHAYVGLHLDNLQALDDLVLLIGRVEAYDDCPVSVELRLSWGAHSWSHERVPAGALAFLMTMTVDGRRGQERPPRRGQLAMFTQRLRLAAVEAGLLIPPRSSKAGSVLLAERSAAAVRFLRPRKWDAK